jgi:hypothetical protein
MMLGHWVIHLNVALALLSLCGVVVALTWKPKKDEDTDERD